MRSPCSAPAAVTVEGLPVTLATEHRRERGREREHDERFAQAWSTGLPAARVRGARDALLVGWRS